MRENEFDEDQRANGYSQCRKCRSDYLKEWRAKNPGRNAALCKKWGEENADRKRELGERYRADSEHQEIAKQKAAEWYRKNKLQALQWARDNLDRQRPLKNARYHSRKAEDPAFVEYVRRHGRVTRAKRRCAENSALADHYREEIKAIYFNCPSGHEIDHIRPLIGKRDGVHVASGLHVPWNLQALPMRENRSKSCKLLEEL